MDAVGFGPLFGVTGGLHTLGLGLGLGLNEMPCHYANQDAGIDVRLEVALSKWALLITPSATTDVEP
ncbi:unnamed protein product [Clonostachys rosea f. rosea IK726]|uniref:Uncharacterized protein n=1 Tax=Clonostachys rosea f. rosea IK726 TaxID=1349383 RepID=A0ACA9UKZ2_BIOOC|nr:unnamed protein product [Clonostachys rosea f. rosea IK726]